MSSKRLRVVFIAAITTLFFFYFQSQTGERTSWLSHAEKNVDWSRFAYTQYVTNSQYLCNSLMFFEALKRHGSRPDRVMMVPESMLEPEMVNSSDAYLLNKAREEYSVKLVPITIQTNWAGDATWADSYTKLLAFNQTNYDRVLSIDSDSLLLQAMDELFFLPDAPVAMPRAYWISPEKVLSSQLMLIQPSEIEFSRIMERVQSVKSGEYDMEIVNQLYGDSALIFPHRRYDLLSGEFRNDKHAQYLGSELGTWDPAAAYSEAKLIHFSDWPLPKPWKPMLEEDRLAAQPNCTQTTSGEEDCTARIIWNSLYSDFRAKRKNIVQKLQELPVPQCPTKQYTTGSQILEIIDKAKPHRKVEIENDPNDEDNDVIGQVCWSKIRKSPVLEENFWPSIRKHILADDPDAIPIKAICTICWDELRVTCISPDDKHDFGFFAPCGHIMCRVCWPREYNPSHSPFQDCRL
ncbi:hypothetical protein J7337_010047 [Fusarium musae]|uniref:RING-type domain-containing protein n=1 Tax=Fusarium musae TaxID=1042133 RepID=A0A9P8DC88_9HYPO|nr:hypothetical protein J7337_010047 [Fusarium musae]KAG9499228.1 hypothetical protein J7337_010047 [Fusarium musae]